MNSSSLPAVLGQLEARTKPGNNSLFMWDREGSPVKGEPEVPAMTFSRGIRAAVGFGLGEGPGCPPVPE